jgi:hypothetical protein
VAIKTILEQLESVQAAIAIIEEGSQEYQIGGRRATRADLKTLYDREAQLKADYQEEQTGTTALAGAEGAEDL